MIRLRDLVAKLRISHDKQAGQQAEGEVRGSFDRIGQAARRLGLVIAAAFSVRAIVRFARSAVDAFQVLQRETNLARQQVQNLGIAWEDADASLKALTDQLWHTHRLTGGEILPIFRTLINVTGDYETSLNSVGLAADMAAALNMDAATAARYLGRILNGDINVLRRYGIELDASRDILEQLTERFGGAAKAGTTGADSLRKAWGDFKEAMGGALSAVLNIEDGLEGLAGVVRRMTEWVQRHEQTWRSLGETVSWLTRWVLAPLVRGILAVGRAIIGVGQIILGAFLGIVSLTAHGVALLAQSFAFAREQAARFMGLFSPERAAEMRRSAAEIREHARAIREWANAVHEAGRAQARAGLGFGEPGDLPQPGAVPPATRRTGTAPGTGGAPAEAAELPTPQVGLIGEQLPALAPTAEQVAAARDRHREYADAWLMLNDDLVWAAETASMGVTQAWQDAFDAILKEGEGFGEFMEALGRGMGAALLAGLSDYAQQKQRAALAEAIQQTALGIGAAAWGNMAAASAHFKSAATHTAAAMAWAALAGGAASAAGAVRSGGAGGGGVGGASNVGGAVAQRAERPGAELNVYFVGEGFDALNPAVQKVVMGAIQEHTETAGAGARVRIHKRAS